MTSFLRDHEAAKRWVCASLVLQRGANIDAEKIKQSIPWVESAIGEVSPVPPLGMIGDIGRILSRGQYDLSESFRPGHEHLHLALQGYEEHFLGKIFANWKLDPIRDALARLNISDRPDAIAIFISQIVTRLGGVEFPAISIGVIRDVIHWPPEDIFEYGFNAIRDDDETVYELVDVYQSITSSAKRVNKIFESAEVFIMENHHALRGSAQRVAITQVAQAADEIKNTLPVKLKPSQKRMGHTPTRLEDETAYPIGGYSSVSNSGPMESLVSSELIYMDEGNSVDLFDIRWASNELLKYTRDESVFVRQKRNIHFVLDSSLEGARTKDAGVPWQKTVLISAMIVAGVAKVTKWLDENDLEIHVSFPPGSLEKDRRLLELLLREWVELGIVTINEGDREQVDGKIIESTKTAQTDGIFISTDGSDTSDLEEENVFLSQLMVGNQAPVLTLSGSVIDCEHDDLWSSWLSSMGSLIKSLV